MCAGQLCDLTAMLGQNEGSSISVKSHRAQRTAAECEVHEAGVREAPQQRTPHTGPLLKRLLSCRVKLRNLWSRDTSTHSAGPG